MTKLGGAAALLVLCACAGARGPAAPAAPPPPAATPEAPLPPPPAAPVPAPDAGLPPPLPPPELPPLPIPEPPPPAADAADPLELLWGHRIAFAAGGEPLVTIRLMDGQKEIAFRARGPARITLRGGGTLDVPANVRLTVRARGAAPGRLRYAVVVSDPELDGRDAMLAQRAALEADGLAARIRSFGAVYGIAGKVIDNRREQLVVDGDGTEAGARALVQRLREKGIAGRVQDEVLARPAGTLLLSGPGGAPLGEADAALTVVVEGDAGFVVESVEHGLAGGSAREDRAYRGRLYVALDPRGALAAIHGVPLEELLRGIVPSEMPASAPLEALKAQAVTARSNVLAQLGTRHLNEPFMICAEVHCQAYRGEGARTARTDEAVRATRGEALFERVERTERVDRGRAKGQAAEPAPARQRAPGEERGSAAGAELERAGGPGGQASAAPPARLVDGVYSAMCGGHGEDNDAVWGNAPSASLRGHPDAPPDEAARWPAGLSREPDLRAFLAAPSNAYCRVPTARRDRFRWERRLDPARLRELGEALGVGRIRDLRVLARGSSGRARTVRVEGERGAIELGPELRIRRALGDLPSAMFVVDRDGEALVLSGGGWGHGVGLCQWGAVGRAMTGQGYLDILRAYFSGAEAARIY